eukprot:gene4597-5739_t
MNKKSDNKKNSNHYNRNEAPLNNNISNTTTNQQGHSNNKRFDKNKYQQQPNNSNNRLTSVQVSSSNNNNNNNSNSNETSVNQWSQRLNLSNSGGSVNNAPTPSPLPTTTTTTTTTTSTTTNNTPKQLPVLFDLQRYKEMVKKQKQLEKERNGGNDEDEDDTDDLFDSSSSCCSSSDDSDSDGGGSKSTFVNNIFGSYLEKSNPNSNENSKYMSMEQKEMIISKESNLKRLINEVVKGVSSCLVCLERVKTRDPSWNCSRCFCILHLSCAQTWSRERLTISAASESCTKDGNPPFWCCPKCRNNYYKKDYPTQYKCYCEKKVEPEYDPWVTPHSCGEICRKKLLGCSHTCNLLCHPGPCCLCPQQIRATCYCGAENRVQRCSLGTQYECDRVCGAKLPCGHKCESKCHSGEHRPCQKSGVYKCKCGNMEKAAPCSEQIYSCGKVCGKQLGCKHHNCQEICHEACPKCPLSEPRPCGCGRRIYNLPCTVPVTPNCESTCDKLLSCGVHKCTKKCHHGECTPCRVPTVKTCRCKRTQEKVFCSNEQLLCQNKCNNQRNCKKHKCKKKCCAGDCPDCDEVCGEKLLCGNHKCESTCHSGRCLPCIKTVKVFCNCKQSFVLVPCGTEKKCPVPRCSKSCRIPSTCHHPDVKRHRCHFGTCPTLPCTKICNLAHPECNHTCPLPCHDPAPKISFRLKPTIEHQSQIIHPITKEKPVVIPPPMTDTQAQKLCPPCEVPIDRICLGKHTIKTFACHIPPDYSCGVGCGNLKECGNHHCSRECHTINYPRYLSDDKLTVVEKNTQSILLPDTCQKCELPCQNPRPQLCTHKCSKPCHLGGCPDCEKIVKRSCYCTSITLNLPCHKYTVRMLQEGNKESIPLSQDIFSCTQMCRKSLPKCTHNCRQICHPNQCQPCDSKLKVYCPCKTIKEEWSCQDAQKFRLENKITNVHNDKLLKCKDGCVPTTTSANNNTEEHLSPLIIAKKEPVLSKEQKKQRDKERRDAQQEKWRLETEEIEKSKRNKELKSLAKIIFIVVSIIVGIFAIGFQIINSKK